MKYEWDSQINEWLKKEKGISFEKIIFHLSRGNLWKLADHSDRENCLGQRIYFVVVGEYVYLVPHVVEKDYIFLQTIMPSRKATKAYRAEQEG